MAQALANRQGIPPRVREAVEANITDLNALTFSATPTQAEAEALRDAVVAVLNEVFGGVDS